MQVKQIIALWSLKQHIRWTQRFFNKHRQFIDFSGTYESILDHFYKFIIMRRRGRVRGGGRTSSYESYNALPKIITRHSREGETFGKADQRCLGTRRQSAIPI